MSRLRIVVLVAFASLVASVASAQQASITGIAMDESKAVLPGVNVTATDQAAGRTITAVTNDKGQYLLQNMPPGKYTLQAELSGFSSVHVQGRRAAGRTERHHPLHDEAGVGHRDADRRRRDAAGRYDLVAGGRQRRPPSDGTAAAPGPQLDGAVQAGEGRHRQRRRQQHRHRRDGRPVAAQPRRPADHPEGRRLRASASRSSAASRSPSSRSSPTCSTSRRDARPAWKSRRFPSRAPTTSPAAPTATSAAIRSTARTWWR